MWFSFPYLILCAHLTSYLCHGTFLCVQNKNLCLINNTNLLIPQICKPVQLYLIHADWPAAAEVGAVVICIKSQSLVLSLFELETDTLSQWRWTLLAEYDR